jgi:hypothetical protein
MKAPKPSRLPRHRSENFFVWNSAKIAGKSEMIRERSDETDDFSGEGETDIGDGGED